MTLFSSLSVGASAINVNQLALSVVGNNIANAGTEGYVREDLKVGTLDSTRYGTLNIGSGATATSTQQQIDRFLRERSREADSSFAAADARATLYDRVQAVFNELGDKDLSSAVSSFFSSIQNLSNRPDDPTLRDVVFRKGYDVAGQIKYIQSRLDDISRDISSEVSQSAEEVNSTLKDIRDLNRQIVAAEAGSPSDAGALRSQRDQQLSKLSNLIPIQARTQADGSVNVLVDGDFLLFNGTIQEVTALDESSAGIPSKVLAIKNSQWPIPTDQGRLGGIQDFRDGDLGAITAQINSIAKTLIYEFNKIHSSGQGLEKFTSLEGTYRTLSASATLNSPAAALDFSPKNGSFDINVTDIATGQNRIYKIDVDLDGVGTDDSLNSVINRINTVAFGGQAVASVTNQGRVAFNAPAGQSFQFGNDTSGFLASFGLNTFFTGDTSRNISLNEGVVGDFRFLATSQNGLPGNNQNVLALAQLSQKTFAGLNGLSIDQSLTGIVQNLATSGSQLNNAKAVLETTKDTLKSKDLAITGVDINEEAVKLIKFQRAFQASAKYLTTINDLLNDVINILR
ncbi:flagellar hook-associated protein FlgK [bacterium]|nr:flagellar hook-associated protein FlgK [bacterium]